MVSGLLDASGAIELAPRVWWVGARRPDNTVLYHSYLLEQGEQSVLIDPGSALTSDDMIRKINSVIGLGNVRWLICSHAEPDVIGALPSLVANGLHRHAAIVTHERSETLIVHGGLPLEYWRIEDHDWRLELEDLALRFVFTPYLHSAGSFVSFEETSGTLFSSDILGGRDEVESLFATSLAYFDSVRTFHEQYMPSREILAHAVQKLRELPVQRVAPRRGQVVPSSLVEPLFNMLEKLECGIHLLARDEPGLAFLLAANQTLHDVVDTLVREQHFSGIATHLAGLASHSLGAEYLELWAATDNVTLRFDRSDAYGGRAEEPTPDVALVLSGAAPVQGRRLILPLSSPSARPGQVDGAIVLGFDEPRVLNEPTMAVITQIIGLVEVGLEREVLLRTTDLERATWHTKAIHDTLTGLYNRVSLEDLMQHHLKLDDGHTPSQVAVLMIDVDHFKAINDTLGHLRGDQVLRAVAQAITQSVRPEDLVFRFGGEEFLVLLTGVDVSVAMLAADRIRTHVGELVTAVPSVTVSVGVALRHPRECYEALIARADDALYRAKLKGRNRVETML
ncbi:MAG: diguanylate cyclase [Acidimicrobiales bacterium]